MSTKHGKWTEDETSFLRENYQTRGTQFCAEHLSRIAENVRQKGRALGMKVNREVANRIKGEKVSAYRRAHPKMVGYNVEVEQFLNIKTKEVAYFLGYFWADGSMNRQSIRLEITEDDGKAIEGILDMLGKWGKYRKQAKQNGADFGRPQMVYATSNRRLCELLSELDYKTKSQASPDKILEKIPAELHRYFWRGYLDGDGCLSVRCQPSGKIRSITLAFWGTIDQDWSALTALCDHLNVRVSKKTYRRLAKNGKYHQSSCLSITKREEMKSLLDWIYGDAQDVGLPRKREKYHLFLKVYHDSPFNQRLRHQTQTDPQIIALLRSGVGYDEIRRQISISQHRINVLVKKHGLSRQSWPRIPREAPLPSARHP